MLIYLIGYVLALILMIVGLKLVNEEVLIRDLLDIIFMSLLSYIIVGIYLWIILQKIIENSTLFDKKLF
jgi:hypothetical protein